MFPICILQEQEAARLVKDGVIHRAVRPVLTTSVLITVRPGETDRRPAARLVPRLPLHVKLHLPAHVDVVSPTVA